MRMEKCAATAGEVSRIVTPEKVAVFPQEFTPLTIDEKCEIGAAEVEAAEAVIVQVSSSCETHMAQAAHEAQRPPMPALFADHSCCCWPCIFACSAGHPCEHSAMVGFALKMPLAFLQRVHHTLRLAPVC